MMNEIRAIIDVALHIDRHLNIMIQHYHAWAYVILFAIIFSETGLVVTVFLPGDSLLFATGALIAHGNTGLNIVSLILILSTAAVLGNMLNYTLGYHLGHKIFKANNKVLKLAYYLRARNFFDHHGSRAVMLSRFLPIIRTLVPFIAGVGRMQIGRYIIFSIIGAFLWITGFSLLGYLFGNIPVLKKNLPLLILGIAGLSGLPLLYAAIKARLTKL